MVMKLLIIDDSTVNNILIQNILEDQGYYVRTALNGKEALDEIEKFSPDLIFLDLMMPGISGFQLLEKFQEKNIFIPVVIISAFNKDEYKEKAKQLGAKGYLLKPVNRRALISAVHDLC
jgi:CheY-like chemotaxis protein